MATVAELAALDYIGGAAALLAGDFTAQIAQHGEPIRWWKAYSTPRRATWTATGGETANDQGLLFVEQTGDWKALFYKTANDWFDEAGDMLIPSGSTGCSVDAGTMELARNDRIVPTGPVIVQRELLTKVAGNDALLQPFVAGISVVMVAGAVVASSHYSLVPGATDFAASALHWISGAPATGDPVSVEYTYNPVYEYLGNSHRKRRIFQQGAMQVGSDGMLPQRGILRLIQP